MSLSMYQASVPVFLRMLSNLNVVLDKSIAHVAARKLEPAALLNARLYPDMFPLVRQVQLAADFAKNTSARLAGVELPKFADTETSFAELKERIAKTAEFLKTLKPGQIDGTEEKEITFPDRRPAHDVQGTTVSIQFRACEFLFSSDDGLCDSAPQRRRARQARLSRGLLARSKPRHHGKGRGSFPRPFALSKFTLFADFPARPRCRD